MKTALQLTQKQRFDIVFLAAAGIAASKVHDWVLGRGIRTEDQSTATGNHAKRRPPQTHMKQKTSGQYWILTYFLSLKRNNTNYTAFAFAHMQDHQHRNQICKKLIPKFTIKQNIDQISTKVDTNAILTPAEPQ